MNDYTINLENEIRRIGCIYRASKVLGARQCYEQYVQLILPVMDMEERSRLEKMWNEETEI